VPGFERFMLSFEVLSFEAWFVEKWIERFLNGHCSS
jgi:hypothetical protein